MTVRCPGCGADISEGGGFCSYCGHELPPDTAGRCPECGELNRPSNVFCDECGARLIPSKSALPEGPADSPVGGLSLPSGEASPDDDIPDWLAQLSSDLPDEESEEAALPEPQFPPREGGSETAPPANRTDEDTPDRLQAASESSGSAEASAEESETPDLPPAHAGETPPATEDEAQEPAQTPELPQDAPLPADEPEAGFETGPQDLAPEGPTDGQPEQEAAPAADEQEGEPEVGKAPEPIEESAPEPLPPSVVVQRKIDTGELREWLAEIVPEEDVLMTLEELALPVEAPPSPQPSEGEIEPGEPPPAADVEIEPGEIPDWLQEMAPTKAAPPAPEPLPADVGIEPDELLEWLDEVAREEPSLVGEGEIEPAEPPQPPEEPEAEQVVTAPRLVPTEAEIEASELPEWLEALAPEEAGLEVPLVAAQTEPRGLLRRLKELAPDEAVVEELEAAAVEAEVQPEPVELPEWPSVWPQEQEMAPQEAALGVPPTPPSEPETMPTELPEWGEEPAPAEAAWETPVPAAAEAEIERGEVPEWLKEIVAPEARLEVPAAGEIEIERGELPEWLEELVPPEAVPEIPALDAVEVEGRVEPDELPEWLQEIPPEVPEPAPAEPDVQIEPGKLPEWLQEIITEAPELEPSEAEVQIEPSEMLEWLQEFAPGEAVPEAPELEPSEAEVQIEPSEMLEWLQESAPGEAVPEAPEPAAAEAEVDVEPSEAPERPSARLQEIAAQEAVTEPPAPAAIEAQIGIEPPEWFEEILPTETAAEIPEELAAAGERELELGELPDWLQEIAPTALELPEPLFPTEETWERPPEPSEPTPEVPPLPPAAEPLEAEALADWLGAAVPAIDSELAPAQPLVGTEGLAPPELPDWLAAVSDVPATEFPDWLTELEGDALAPTAEGAPELAEQLELGPLPPWLSPEDAGLGPPEPEVPAPELETAEMEATAVPDWLRAVPEAGVEPDIEPGVIPDWLRPPTGLEQVGELVAEEIAPEEGLLLSRAAIPDWLQALKPPEPEERPPGEGLAAELEFVETGGPLEGLRGALPAEAVVSVQPATRPVPQFVVTEQQQLHAQALERIVHAGPEARPEVSPPSRTQTWVERGVITVLILLAVLLPALWGNPLLNVAREPAISDEINAAYDQLESLPGSALALVAFDYSPAAAGELRPVSAAMVRHLLTRRVRILTVSTTPAGSEIAQSVMKDLADGYGYKYGTDYLNLGYIPGGAVGLQAFATKPWELFAGHDYLGEKAAARDGREPVARRAAAADGLEDSLADVNLLLIFTADRADLVGWIEQVGRLRGMEVVPMVAGVSASLESWALPYYQSAPRQLDGVVSGVPGAARYELRLDQPQARDAGDLNDSQTAGLAVAVLVAAVGLLWGGVVGVARRRRGDE